MSNKEGVLFVISGPSGAGKTTAASRVLESYPNFTRSVTATTRAPRGQEQNGVDYHFMRRDDFVEKLASGAFLEHVTYAGNLYGTLSEVVSEDLRQGKDVLLVIEVTGALNIKKLHPDAVLIFVVPPKFSDLRRRLISRGTEKEAVIDDRLAVALSECKSFDQYDYVVINDDVSRAAEDIFTIRNAEHLRPRRNNSFLEEM